MPPNIKLESNHALFLGPPSSGKSTLVKRMLMWPEYRSHLVYDPLYGFDPEVHNIIRPPNQDTRWRRYEDGNPELNRAVDDFVINVSPERRPKILVVDEAGRLLPNQKDEGAAMGDLNDFNEHYGTGVWLLGQRPAQINTDFENKAIHKFVLGFEGKNDLRAYEDMHEEAAKYLKASGKYGVTYMGPNNTIANFSPVEPYGEKAMF